MNAHLAFVAYCFVLPACTRHSPDVQLPEASLTHTRQPANGYEMIINIDKHGHRVIHERRSDSDDALTQSLVQWRAQWPHAAVVIRADSRAAYESVLRVVLLARQAGYSAVSVATRVPNSPLVEEHLKFSYE